MSICIVAATSLELEYLRTQASPKRYDVLVTGVGTAATVYQLAKKIQNNKPNLFIQAGIAGSFNHAIPLGAPVVIDQDRFADLGVSENGQWKDVFDMELEKPNDAPYSNGWLRNPHHELLNSIPLQRVPAISINEVTTNTGRIRAIREKYDPAIESMEGAAFHFVCLQEGVPFIQIRAVSNYVGERDKRKWKMEQAIQNLGRQVHELLQKLA